MPSSNLGSTQWIIRLKCKLHKQHKLEQDIYTQEFCPKQFNNKRKNTFFMSKSRVTHKSRNGEGDIHFKSITVSLLLRCHLFWETELSIPSYCHFTFATRERKNNCWKWHLRIQSELFRINIILKAQHLTQDVLFRKIYTWDTDMRWLLFSEYIDVEGKMASPPTSAVEFGWNRKWTRDGRLEGTQGGFSQTILSLGGALIPPSTSQPLFPLHFSTSPCPLPLLSQQTLVKHISNLS